MAEEKVDSREVTWRQLLPWTELFRAFQVALDLNKLLLAAGGILMTAFFWWLLAVIFTTPKLPPDWGQSGDPTSEVAWAKFRRDRQHWNLEHEAADLAGRLPNDVPPPVYTVEDVAETLEEYNLLKPVVEGKSGQQAVEAVLNRAAELEKQKGQAENARRYRARAPQYARLGMVKPAGRLLVSPWSEDRGPNPYLLLTGQVGVPWEPAHFWDWFLRDQFPVMVEPLIKLVRPIVYFLSPRNDWWSRTYFFLVTLVTLLIWSFVGGAISRIAVVQLARGERIGLIDSLRFACRFGWSYIFAPLFPVGFVLVLVILMAVFGLFHMIPVVGDILVDGFLWPIPQLFGLVIAMTLVGLLGWPFMSTTVSAEGTDSWEAVSRAYSYVYQRPWSFAWYGFVALLYGGVVVFFVGFMGSMMVYLAKWGVNTIQPASRDTSFLFVYAPKSFGWRELLLEGTKVQPTDEQIKQDPSLAAFDGRELVRGRDSRPPGAGQVGGVSRWDRIDLDAYNAYLKTMSWWNKGGAILVAFWLGLVFLMVVGFGYAFFWTAMTIIYLLLRKSVDLNEMDEVYMEEDEYDAGFSIPPTTPPRSPAPALASAAPVTPVRTGTALPLVEAPPQRPAAPAVSAAPPAVPLITPTPAPPPAAPATPVEEKPVEKVIELPKTIEKPPAEPEKPSESEKSGGAPPVV